MSNEYDHLRNHYLQTGRRAHLIAFSLSIRSKRKSKDISFERTE